MADTFFKSVKLGRYQIRFYVMDGRCFTITLQRYKKYFEYTTKDAGLYPAKQTKQSSALTRGEEDGVGTSLQD